MNQTHSRKISSDSNLCHCDHYVVSKVKIKPPWLNTCSTSELEAVMLKVRMSFVTFPKQQAQHNIPRNDLLCPMERHLLT